jgi:hypothetical protein
LLELAERWLETASREDNKTSEQAAAAQKPHSVGHPQKRTSAERSGMSAKCQKRTYAILAARLRLRANPRAILDLVHDWPPAFRAAIALKISAHVGCAPLGFRFRGGLWFSRQLENCGLLTLTQRRQEHDLAIRKL